jgi:hypothetical protein
MGSIPAQIASAGCVTNITHCIRSRPNTPAMHKNSVVLAAAAVLLALLTIAATPNGMAPLPAQYLHDGTFHSPDGWFEIHVPMRYEWFEMRAFDGKADPRWPDALNQTVAWLTRDPKTFDDLVVMESYTPGADVIGEAYARAFEERTREAVKPEVMSDYSAELLTIGGERSLHYRYKLTGKTRPPIYRFGYVIGMVTKVTLSTSDAKPTEPKRLIQSAISVRWLKES